MLLQNRCIVAIVSCLTIIGPPVFAQAANQFPINDGIYCTSNVRAVPEGDDIYGEGIMRIQFPLVRYNYAYCEVSKFKKIDEDYKVVLSCSTEDEDVETKDLWTVASSTQFQLKGETYSKCSELKD